MTKKNALVTGASAGIGQATAVRLAKDGFHVFIHYHRNAVGAEKTLSMALAGSGSAEVLSFDVKDKTAVDTMLEPRFKDRPLDILVNNAGIHKDNLAGMMSDLEFQEVMETNVFGAFYLLRWAIRKMIRQRSGGIVNVASLAGQVGNVGQLNYSASKAALIAMTKTLSQEVGSRGIRVNAVAPGLIDTEMLKSIPHLEDLVARIPLKRLGTAEEVASAVAFLCSNESSYITGHTLSINGGLFPA